jgi:hypothetical protein
LRTLRLCVKLVCPSIVLDRSPAWEINLRVGAGMARSVNPRIVKMILGYRFDL